MKSYNRLMHQADNSKNYKGIVAAYMRYSSDNQDEKSIEYQRDAITEYCKNNDYFLFAEYWDEAYTGTNDRRPSFQKLIEDAQNSPPWDTILVFDYSRWFRDTNHSTLYECQLFELGIDVFSITEQFDTSSEGLLMRDIKKAFNAFTSRNIGKFSRAGMLNNANKAEHCGGKPPLGYDIVNKKLVINESEANIVKRIFDMYENNFSYNKMAEDLNSKGYRTKFGQPFTFNSFDSILHQEKYTGTYVWNKSHEKNTRGSKKSQRCEVYDKEVKTPNAVPVIISQEQFDRVQQMFKNRRSGTATSKNRNHYLLSGCGFLKCAECGALMIGSIVSSHGNRYKYYYCPNHKKKLPTCSNVGIQATFLDEFVIRVIVKDIYKRDDLISLYNTSEEKDKVHILKNQIAGLEKTSKNLVKELVKKENKESLVELRAELNDVNIRKKALKEELEYIKASLVTLTESDRKNLCKKIKKLMITGDSLEVRKYLKETISEILVSDTDVKITLNIT